MMNQRFQLFQLVVTSFFLLQGVMGQDGECECLGTWMDTTECKDGIKVQVCVEVTGKKTCTKTVTCKDPCLGVICIQPTSPCLESKCNPLTGRCEVNYKPDGTSCNDGNACTQRDICRQGQCVGTSPVVCTASDQCHDVGRCDPLTGKCTDPIKADGSKCDDGDLCTQVDVCRSGNCVGTAPVQCKGDECHFDGKCDPKTGKCDNPTKADGTVCNDGNLCTKTDICREGKCVGTDEVTCPAPDLCHLDGRCIPTTGQCSNPVAPDGTKCNDGNACTQRDVCRQGTCYGLIPVICTAADQCHDAPCDPLTGKCSVGIPKPLGTPCDDGDTCTDRDACTADGKCVGIKSCFSSAQKNRRHSNVEALSRPPTIGGTPSLPFKINVQLLAAGLCVVAVATVLAVVIIVKHSKKSTQYTTEQQMTQQPLEIVISQ